MGYRFRDPGWARRQLEPLESRPTESEVGRGGASRKEGNRLGGSRGRRGNITVGSGPGIRKTCLSGLFLFPHIFTETKM